MFALSMASERCAAEDNSGDDTAHIWSEATVVLDRGGVPPSGGGGGFDGVPPAAAHTTDDRTVAARAHRHTSVHAHQDCLNL